MTEVETSQPRDFPGGPVVKNPSCSAEDAGLIPGQGTKIPRAAGQLHTTTTELACSGAHVPQLERRPRTATKSLCAATERSHMLQLTPNAAKINK